MSRIHDALKKAAEERASRSPSSSFQELVDVAEEIRQQVPPMRDNSPTTVTTPARNSSLHPLLRYEELLKQCAHPKWNLDPRFSVFENEETKKSAAERFRTLRSRLYQIAGTHNLKRILVTSSLPAEGKTFVAANLAQSIVRQPDRRVLLIDADLRASSLHQTLGAPKTPGLADYLRGKADEYSIIQNAVEENLCLIPAGNEVANPSELLLSERMTKLLELVTPIFEWVILDSPPALPVHDASMMADMCDGILFVVRAGVTSFETAEKAVLEFRNKKMLGVVLNRVEEDPSYDPYYYGYGDEKGKD